MSHADAVLALMEEKGGWLTCQQITAFLEEDGYFERNRLNKIQYYSYVSRWLQHLYKKGKVQQRFDGYRSEWKAFP